MEEIEINKNYNLGRLQRWLDYELSSSVLYLLGWIWAFAIILAITAAIVFIPFMLKILFEERRFGWIITFFIIVVAPLAGLFFVDNGFLDYQTIFGGIILVMFYFYCFTLKLAIKGWIRPS